MPLLFARSPVGAGDDGGDGRSGEIPGQAGDDGKGTGDDGKGTGDDGGDGRSGRP